MAAEEFVVPVKFAMGQTVATRGVVGLLSGAEMSRLLIRHANGDWGELCAEDKELNDHALATGSGRLFSAYTISHSKGWTCRACS